MDDLERQLHNYWSDITDGYPLPDVGPLLGVLQLEPETPTSDDYWVETITLEATPERPARPRWYVGVAAVSLLVVAFSGVYVISRTIGLNPGAEVITPNIVPDGFYDLSRRGGTSAPWDSRGDLIGTQPKPNIINATPGDDGDRPLPLGTVTEFPTGVYADLLPENCQAEGCTQGDRFGFGGGSFLFDPDFGDANFFDPENPTREVRSVTARGPIFVRQGFVNETEEPLGNGFDVALYAIEQYTPGPFGGNIQGDTTRYTSDYVIRGESDRCGPNYETQDGPVTCEWFVFEFADGFPAESFVMWAVWEAPCDAWIDLGYTDFCADADEVMSFFATAVILSFESSAPTVAQNNGLNHPLGDSYNYEVGADASGSRASDGTPLPDARHAIPGDDGTDALPIGAVTELPVDDYLDFLFESCSLESQPQEQGLGVVRSCSRSAAFVQPDNPDFGAGTSYYGHRYTSGLPFYVRQGFVNDTSEPLGEEFDVALYVFEMDEDGGFGGVTKRYTSDYVVRGETDRCGPGYNDQTGTVTCEWFVHEFPNGLPEGRFALWAVWEAPCRAWIDLGFTVSCDDPNEVTSFFSSGTDNFFDSASPQYARPRPVRRTSD